MAGAAKNTFNKEIETRGKLMGKKCGLVKAALTLSAGRERNGDQGIAGKIKV